MPNLAVRKILFALSKHQTHMQSRDENLYLDNEI